MSNFRTLDDARDLTGKTALVRVDFNGPMEGGRVTDDTRLRVALPTIQRLRDAGAKVALLAHFDRPKGERVPSMSLKPVVDDAVGFGWTLKPPGTVISDTPDGSSLVNVPVSTSSSVVPISFPSSSKNVTRTVSRRS